jgi:VWFA-related protein
MGSHSGRLVLLVLSSMCGAFGQTPPKLIAFDIVADAAGLQGNEIRLYDDKKAQSVLYCHSGQQHPENPRVTVVVFNLAYAGIKSYAWNETIRTMRQFESSEFLYFYVKTGRGALLPVHGLPEKDAESPPTNLRWIDRNLPPIEKTLPLEPLLKKSGITSMISLAPYVDLAARLAAFPAQKNLICIGCLSAKPSEWDPSPFGNEAAYAAELRQLSDALARARVAVYTVHGSGPSGLVGAGNGAGVTNRPGGLQLFPGGIAEVTGGRTYSSGQIMEAIQQAVRDRKSTYRIAYLPPPENWDGKRHKITIGSTRSGVHLLAPRWYIAEPQESEPIPKVAITSPFDQTDIAVSVSVPKSAENAQRIEIRVDAADLLLMPRNSRYSGSIAMQTICYTPDQRKRACTEPASVKLDLSRQEYATAISGGLRFPIEVPADEAFSRIRVLVRDEYSGAMGTATFVRNEER